MNRDQLLQQQEGFRELRAFELEEQRNRTPEERLRQLDAIWLMAQELGIPIVPNDFDWAVNEQWGKIRSALGKASD